MKRTAGPVLAALAILGTVGFAIWWDVSVWQECRQTNSWFYCWRVISR